MKDLGRHVVGAIKSWRRTPGVASAIVGLLTLGLGGVLAIAAPFVKLTLAPLPFPNPEELVRIGGNLPLFSSYEGRFERRTDLAGFLSNVSAFSPVPPGPYSRFAGQGRARIVNVTAVTSEFFEVFGVQPAAGRTFASEAENAALAILSHRLWQTELGGREDVVGSSVVIGTVPRLVVGIMPSTFDFPAGTEIWLPFRTAPSSSQTLQFLGRLKKDIGIKTAAAGLQAVGFARRDAPSGQVAKAGPVVQSLTDFLGGERRATLVTFGGASLLFLLLTTVGVANLLHARGNSRKAEVAVRLACGANRFQLVGQFVMETFVLVALAGAMSLWLSQVAGKLIADAMPGLGSIEGLTTEVVVLVAGLIVAVTSIAGVMPALRATDVDLATILRSGASVRNTKAGHSRKRVWSRRSGPCLQVAVAVSLLICGATLLKAIYKDLGGAFGFEPSQIAVVQIELPPTSELITAGARFFQANGMRPFSVGGRSQSDLLAKMNTTLESERRRDFERKVGFFRDLKIQVAGFPEVSSIGAMFPAPFTAEADFSVQFARPLFAVNPRETVDPPRYVKAIRGKLDEDAVDVLNAHLLSGRLFAAEDVANEAAGELARGGCTVCSSPSLSAIVTRRLEQELWPGESAIGKVLYDPPLASRTVVGVLDDLQLSMANDDRMPAAFYPFTGDGGGALVAKLRSGGSVSIFSDKVDHLVGTMATDVPALRAVELTQLANKSLSELRTAMALLGGFAIIGLIVAGLGVYSVMSAEAARAKREIGVKMALGANGQQIRNELIGDAVRLSGVALPVGIVGGLLLLRGLGQFLAATQVDWILVAACGIFVLIFSALAGLQPAIQAASVNQATILKEWR